MLNAVKHLYRAAWVAAWQRCFTCLLFGFWVSLAHAQTSSTLRIYTYVEQMPELPDGGGTGAIASAIMKRIRYPAINTAKQMRYSGIVYTFVVDSAGVIHDAAMIVSSANKAVDQAILTAVRSLPRLQPGRQDGQPVSVRFTLNIGCIKPQ